MRSVRARNLLLVALVLAPVGVLAGLSLSTVDAYRAEVGARMRREMNEMESEFRALAQKTIEEDAAHMQRRVQEGADLVARRLPFESTPVILAAVRGEPMPLPPNSAPSNLRVRVVDGAGRTVVPARFDPDGGPNAGSDQDRLLGDIRRQAEAALFGTGDLAAAQRVWSDARAKFRDDQLKALADVEQAWLAARASTDPTRAKAAFDAVQRIWPSEVLDGVGRTWVLLALAVYAASPDAVRVLQRLRLHGTLDTINLSDEERFRLEWAWRRLPVPDRASVPVDVWTAPLPAGLTLELRRGLPSERDLAEILVEEARQRWPATVPHPEMVVPHRPVAFPPRDDMRQVDASLPGGGSRPVLLAHPERGRLSDLIAARERWTIVGVVALVVLVGLGLHLTLTALRREREARRLKDDFLANVSHELRTPLTSVCLHADLLAEGPLSDAQRRSHAEVVRAEGARLSALVDDLLDFAARERGARRLEPAPVDVGRAVTRAVEPFRVLAEREGVRLEVEVGAEEVSALADPLALERILANLLGNAWKHGRPSRDGAPGRICVTAAAADGGAEVTVRDDGPGIPAAERGALFERFRRGAAAAKTRGVGLGLALSRDLARAMGGDLVVVEDPAETVFRLTLPPVPPAPDGAPA